MVPVAHNRSNASAVSSIVVNLLARVPQGIARPNVLRVAPILLCLAFFTGCISASGGIATSNLPVEGRKYEVIGPAETTVSWWTLDLGIIGLPLADPPVDEAESRLINQNQGDALINLRYWTDRSMFLFIINRHRFHLKADVIRFTDGR
jgi:hypothetical protein